MYKALIFLLSFVNCMTLYRGQLLVAHDKIGDTGDELSRTVALRAFCHGYAAS
jgi:hypothetical protein